MTEKAETYVARVNVNKTDLLLNVVFEGFQILLVKPYNTPGCQTSKCLNSKLDRALNLVV